MSDKSKNQLPDNINWEYLKRFKICAESKNFKEAAQKISTSPYALGAQIDALEESLGLSLFERVNQNRTSKLTVQGDHILQLVSMASLYLSGSRPVKNAQILQTEEKQRIRIITTPGLAASFLPQVVHLFLLKYPDYQIEVTAVGPSVKIQNDEILIRSDIKNQKDILKEKLGDISLNLYASKDYIEKMGVPTNVEDLQYHKVLAFNSFTYGNTNWALLANRGFPVSTHILSNSINFLHEMCCKGYGIVELAEIYSRSPNLVRILENIESPKHTIYIAFHKSNLIKVGTANFLNFALKHAKNKFEEFLTYNSPPT